MMLSMAATAFQAPMLQPAAPALRVNMQADPSTALPFAPRPAALDGSMPGDVGFDPLGFSNYELGPFENSVAHMGWMREAEIKHGRVCMLAVVGWIAADCGLRAPGVPAELKDKALTSFAAHDVAVADGRLLMLIILCGVFEIAGSAGIKATIEGKRRPGDFALVGAASKLMADEKKAAALMQAEIKHCRLAMMALGGIATQTAVASASGGSVAFPYLDF